MKVQQFTRVLLVSVVAVLAACGAPAVVTTPAQPVSPTITALPSPTAATSGLAPWSLVVVGDSIPYNSQADCPGCTSFIDRYATSIIEATGHPVKIGNYSQHNGLQIDDLLGQLKIDKGRRDALANADIIVVGIAHNDTAWNRNDDPCDGSAGDEPDWSKYNATCAAAAAEIFRPKFESVFAQIVALRAGKPTIFRTINAYNDWIGISGVPPEATDATRVVLDAWSAMICKAAQANSFTCADIYHAFNGPDGLTPAGELLAKDTIHPSNKGNEVIARVLADLGYAPLAPSGATTPASSGTSSAVSGLVDIGGGRSLYLDCVGTGSPTVILEVGQGAPRSAMNGVRDALAGIYQVCSYDRANTGASSNGAPTPRTAQAVVDDLAALLAAADVRPPFLLVGHSAGGVFVQLYAAEHPDQVAGVLAMNPVPHAELWLKEALPLMTDDERKEELAYYRGENNESFDWNTSFREIASAGPPQMATVVMLSTIKQCESPDDICGRTYDVYTAFGRALAASIPGGRFVSVEAQHDIYRDDLDAIVTAVANLPKRITSP